MDGVYSFTDQIDKLILYNPDIVDFEFWIDLQPHTLAFGGEYKDNTGMIKPIDLKSIGKIKCSLLAEFIREFHKIHTDNGNNKWNRVKIQKSESKGHIVDFIWDELWEQEERNSRVSQDLKIDKWYWDK